MVDTTQQEWLAQLQLAERKAPEFIRDKNELDQLDPPHPLAHIIRRAFDDLQLDGVLCTSEIDSPGNPIIYFKQVKGEFKSQQLCSLHRKFWNHHVAPLLILIDSTTIRVFSNAQLPYGDEDSETWLRSNVLASFERADKALNAVRFIREAEIGSLFDSSDSPIQYSHGQRIDVDLLQNLSVAREKLKIGSLAISETDSTEEAERKEATIHALLGRMIFSSYLLERNIITSKYVQEACAVENVNRFRDFFDGIPSDSRAKTALYSLFRALKEDFNGDLFSDNLDEEERLIEDAHVLVLRGLFSGDRLKDGQMSLGFWAYDFSIIPIELVSAIYEQFLGSRQSRDGAYYTPRFLTDMVVDIAFEDDRANWQDLLSKRYLDPSCGSGIFLVSIFNRLAEIWYRNNRNRRYPTRFDALKRILTDHLCGVDINPIACRITAFSLYLAFLYQLRPKSIEDIRQWKRKLPLLLHKGGETKPDGHSIFCSDFFAPDLPLKESSFDFVVGNPPWMSWTEYRPANVWNESKSYPVPDGQSAAYFLWKSLEHLEDSGKVALLVPHGFLFNQGSLEFQKHCLLNNTLQKVVNLSNFQKWLFSDARLPALIFAVQKAPASSSHRVEYVAPKTDWGTRESEIILVHPDERNFIQSDLLVQQVANKRIPAEWKRYFWGTERDFKLFDRLGDYPNLGTYLRSLLSR